MVEVSRTHLDQARRGQAAVVNDYLIKTTHRESLERRIARGDYLHRFVKALNAVQNLLDDSTATPKERDGVRRAVEIMMQTHSGDERSNAEITRDLWSEYRERYDAHPNLQGRMVCTPGGEPEFKPYEPIDWDKLSSTLK